MNDYNKALSLCADYADLWYAKADLLYNMGRVQESVLAYKMVTKLEPTNYEAWLDYGETLLELGYAEQSLKAFDKAVESNPVSAEPFYCRAKALIAMHRTYEAVESLKSSFKLNPEMQKMFEEEFPDAKSLKEFRQLLAN